MIIECVGHRFVIHMMSPRMDLGVVKDELGELVLGWSRDEENVHVLDFWSHGEWRGKGLKETLTVALSDLNQQSN